MSRANTPRDGDDDAPSDDDEIGTDNPHMPCLLALEALHCGVLDLDAINGNLWVLLDGLPTDPRELAEEREPIDLERIARQAGVAQRLVVGLREKVESAIEDVRSLARAAAKAGGGVQSS